MCARHPEGKATECPPGLSAAQRSAFLDAAHLIRFFIMIDVRWAPSEQASLLREVYRWLGRVPLSARFVRRAAGIDSLVVMPENASPTKVRASREYGAEVILHGDATAAFERVHELSEERGLTFVHPFDDVDVIAGHASCGMEILEDLADVGRAVVYMADLPPEANVLTMTVMANAMPFVGRG